MECAFKVEYGGDRRRFRLAMPVTLDALQETTRQAFGLHSALKFVYKDEDGDDITVTTPSDLAEAVRLLAGATGGLMRMRVVPLQGCGDRHDDEAKTGAEVEAPTVSTAPTGPAAPPETAPVAAPVFALASVIRDDALAAHGLTRADAVDMVRVMLALGVRPHKLVKMGMVDKPVFRQWRRLYGRHGNNSGGRRGRHHKKARHGHGRRRRRQHRHRSSSTSGGGSGSSSSSSSSGDDAGTGTATAAVVATPTVTMNDDKVQTDGAIRAHRHVGPARRGRDLPVTFVSHANMETGDTLVGAMETAVKEWRVRNESHKAWPARVSIQCDTKGARISYELLHADALANLPAGASATVAVRFQLTSMPDSDTTAPAGEASPVRLVWRVVDVEKGKPFGSRLWCSFLFQPAV